MSGIGLFLARLMRTRDAVITPNSYEVSFLFSSGIGLGGGFER